MDIDSIPFGIDFRAHIEQALQGCKVLIAIVGPNWLGKRILFKSRILDRTDPVRLELQTALMGNVPIIPVLLDGTKMPEPTQLPEDLRRFVNYNAAEFDSGRDFDRHTEKLIRAVDSLLLGKAADPA